MKTTSRELFKYVCDDATSEFVGHCVALMPDNKYLLLQLNWWLASVCLLFATIWR